MRQIQALALYKIMLLANDKNEFESALKGIDITVPRRSEGRTKEHTERYAIAHMLSTLMANDLLSYPIKVIQRERPDFHFKTSGGEIGVEHTEAVPQNKAHKDALRDKVDGPSISFVSRHHPAEPKKSTNELIEEIQANRSGPGWSGDSVERDWAEVMLHSAREKILTFAKPGFSKFEFNWLLIYDNWSLPALDLEHSSNLLLPKIVESGGFDSFDKVFIHTGSSICEFSRSGWMEYEINDIW